MMVCGIPSLKTSYRTNSLQGGLASSLSANYLSHGISGRLSNAENRAILSVFVSRFVSYALRQSRRRGGTPRPIRIVRHAGHGPWDDTANAILSLSKMDWNNDALYDPLPVTIGYAKVLARVVKRMTGLGSAPYQFRFFM